MIRLVCNPLKIALRQSSNVVTSIIPEAQLLNYPHLGYREVVGHGVNGEPEYGVDTVQRPYPSIRWKPITEEYLALRKKEMGDWNLLSLEEKKQLYRHSFRQTLVESNEASPYWYKSIAVVLYLLGFTFLYSTIVRITFTRDVVEKYWNQDEKDAYMVRQLYKFQQRIRGNHRMDWDYEKHDWKKNLKQD